MKTTSENIKFQQNWISPIQLPLTDDQLAAINIIWNYADMFRADLQGFDRSVPSVLREVSKKMLKKQVSRSLTHHQSDKFNLKLQPYQALALEYYIRAIINLLPMGYERHTVAAIAFDINQKLS